MFRNVSRFANTAVSDCADEPRPHLFIDTRTSTKAFKPDQLVLELGRDITEGLVMTSGMKSRSLLVLLSPFSTPCLDLVPHSAALLSLDSSSSGRAGGTNERLD